MFETGQNLLSFNAMSETGQNLSYYPIPGGQVGWSYQFGWSDRVGWFDNLVIKLNSDHFEIELGGA